MTGELPQPGTVPPPVLLQPGPASHTSVRRQRQSFINRLKAIHPRISRPRIRIQKLKNSNLSRNLKQVRAELLEAREEIKKLKKQLKEKEDPRKIKVDGLAEKVREVADAYLELKEDKRILSRHPPQNESIVEDRKKKLDRVVGGIESLTNSLSRLQNEVPALAQNFIRQYVPQANIEDEEIVPLIEQEVNREGVQKEEML